MARRVNYLHYLANLKENEMLYKVFYAQWKHPVKDDWTIQVQKNLEDFELDMTLDDLKKKSANSFKRIMKIKSKEYTLNYLIEIKDSHSKMDNLEYPELKLQNYLRDDEIPLNEARNLYRFRTRVANFKENFKNGHQSCAIPCPLCLVQPDTQAHSLQCPEIREKIDVKGTYSDIFNEDIPSDISKTLLKISELRKDL